MDHYQPKVTTGTAAGTAVAASVTHQVLTALLLGGLVVILAWVIRKLWRRNKHVGQ
jgi:flagellar biogenesis protein FliO